MKKGDLVVRQAEKYLGVYETSTNRGYYIDKWAARWGMVAQPWCGIFVDAMFAEAGVDDWGISHPATSIMCDRARAAGAVLGSGTRAPAGSIWIKCGIHTAIVVEDYGNGTVLTIDGNSGNRVKKNYRPRSGHNIIVAMPKSVIENVGGSPAPKPKPKPKNKRVYYIEDVKAKPFVYRPHGPRGKAAFWAKRAYAEKMVEKLDKDPVMRALKPRVIKVGGKFAIQLGDIPIYGGWDYKASRDAAYKTLTQRLGNNRLRKFSRMEKI